MCVEYAVGSSYAEITTDSTALESRRLCCDLLEHFRGVPCNLGNDYF